MQRGAESFGYNVILFPLPVFVVGGGATNLIKSVQNLMGDRNHCTAAFRRNFVSFNLVVVVVAHLFDLSRAKG